jgi:hypothetical protein
VRLLCFLALILATASVHAGERLGVRLSALAPGLDPDVLARALKASECARLSGVANAATRLAVIDFSRPSTQPRLWVFDLADPQLLYVEHVAHGRGSGEDFAAAFSNVEGSHQTSLGLFRTAETYHGANGYSLRLDGLEPGLNDRARERAIVMHGADYVDPELALRQGRLGRSFGCPALRPEVARPIIDTLKQGQLLFAWHPQWQQASTLSDCAAPALVGGQGVGAAHAAP